MKTVRLNEVLDKVIDYRGKTPKKLGIAWKDRGFRALSALNVKNSGLVKEDQIKFLDEEGYDLWMKEEVMKGDLLLTSEAPAGECLVWNSDEKIVLSQRLFGLRTKLNYSSSFLKYYFQSATGKNEIKRYSTGSTVFGISAKMFEWIQIPDVNFTLQKQIAKVLSDLDAKIEVNNKINQQLEAMAKTLYDYWFVQFDFPVSTALDMITGVTSSGVEKPYKSSGGKMVYNEQLKREIPDGWEAAKFEDLADIIGGSTPSKKNDLNFTIQGGMPWITPKDLSLNKGKKFITRGEWNVTHSGLKSGSLKVMPAGTILFSSRAPIGYLAISREKVTTNQGFKSFIPKEDIPKEFLFYQIKNRIPLIEMRSSGSTFKEVSGSILKQISVIKPPKEILNRYSNEIKPVFDKQDLLEKQNQKLSELRDWLLPMLMNGQIKIKSKVKSKSNGTSSAYSVSSSAVENSLGRVAEENSKYNQQ